ncbi:hypothetical protein V6N13_061162 [Hibiscus sabdariffa]
MQGYGDPKFATITKQYILDYKPDVLGFVELRISSRKVDIAVASLGIPNSYRIEAQERLGHRIRELVSSGIWKAFSLTRNETPLSHLFFSNDLILYARVDLSQARLIAATLEEFSSYYGHWVSARKSQIYFSPNTNPETCAFISSFLGFQHVSNLGKYLRMPVQHSRTKCSDYDFIIDMMRARLNGWASQALSMAGHLTLAKSVLVAIPIYFMQTTRLSI